MRDTDSSSAWITTMYLFPLDAVRSGIEGLPSHAMPLASSGGGFRGPTSSTLWWPQSVGEEAENLGNILVVASFPTTIHFGVRIIVYGRGTQFLDLALVSAEDSSRVLRHQQTRVAFIPLRERSGLGVSSLQIGLVNCRIEESGWYWLSASVGQGSLTQLPIYITERSAWTAGKLSEKEPSQEELIRDSGTNSE